MKKKEKAVFAVAAIIVVTLLAAAASAVFIVSTSLRIKNSDSIQTAGTEQHSETGRESLQENEPLQLIADSRPYMYTYDNMVSDIDTLKRRCPEIVDVSEIGTTVDGRKIYDIIIGDVNVEEHFMLQGSIHAREYITTQLIMMQTADFIRLLESDGGVYKGIGYKELLGSKAVHIVPMVNPDGVSISQLGTDGILSEETRVKLAQIAEADGKSLSDAAYLRQWKSNANGVDLNRNFNALWERYEGTPHISSDHYKGEYPGSENESEALIALTDKYNFVRTISYHTYGQVIYWYFAQTGELKDKTLSFARETAEVTGYKTDDNYEELDPAGYKDWAISAKGIPSLTIEVGTGENPVPHEQLETIWNQNKNILPAMLYNYIYG